MILAAQIKSKAPAINPRYLVLSSIAMMIFQRAIASSASLAKSTRKTSAAFASTRDIHQRNIISPFHPVVPPWALSLRSSFSSNPTNEDQGMKTDDTRHQKTYHIKGTSTYPAGMDHDNSNSNNNNNSGSNKQQGRSRRRSRGCGPGVTVQTVKTNHTIKTDVPKIMGGNDMAPQPVELLIGALCGCTLATSLFVARQLFGSDDNFIRSMDFKISGARDERGALHLPIQEIPKIPSRLQEIKGNVIVTLQRPITDEQLEQLKEQTEARCPIACLISDSGCKMNIEWIQKL